MSTHVERLGARATQESKMPAAEPNTAAPSALKSLLDQFQVNSGPPSGTSTSKTAQAGLAAPVELSRLKSHVDGQPEVLLPDGRWVEKRRSEDSNFLRLMDDATLIAEFDLETEHSFDISLRPAKNRLWFLDDSRAEIGIIDLERQCLLPIFSSSGESLSFEADDSARSWSDKTMERGPHALSPNGTRLATVFDSKITIFNLEEGADTVVAVTERGIQTPLSSQNISWSDSAQWLVLDKAVVDVRTGSVTKLGFAGDSELVCSVFTDDDRHLIAGTQNGEVLKFDLNGSAHKDAIYPVQDSLLHRDECFALALSPDGARLASAGKDRAVRVVDVTTLQPLDGDEPQRHYEELQSLAWLSDHTLRVGFESSGPVDYSVARPSRLTKPFSFQELNGKLPREKTVGQVRIDGAPLESVSQADGIRIRLPDPADNNHGQRLVLSKDGATARVLGRQLLMSFDTLSLCEVTTPRYCKANELLELADGSLALVGADTELLDGKLDFIGSAPADTVASVGSQSFVTLEDSALKLVDVKTMEELYDGYFGWKALDIDQNTGRMVAWSSACPGIEIRSLSEAPYEHRAISVQGTKSGYANPHHMAWAADGNSLFAVTRDTLFHLDEQGETIAKVEGIEGATCLSRSDDGRFVALGYESGAVEVYDVSKFGLHQRFELHEGAVAEIALRGGVLMSLSEDGWLGRHDLTP